MAGFSRLQGEFGGKSEANSPPGNAPRCVARIEAFYIGTGRCFFSDEAPVPSLVILKSGLLLGGFLNTFLAPSHRSLAGVGTLTLTFAMAVSRSLTFWPSSILVWHIDHLLCARE